MSSKSNKLSIKHLAFIEEYMVNGFNVLGAYMKAYPNTSYASAKSNANRMMENDGIKSEIEARKAEFQARYKITLEYIINEWLLQIADCKVNNDRRSLNSAIMGLMKATGHDINKQEITHDGEIRYNLNYGGFTPKIKEEPDDE